MSSRLSNLVVSLSHTHKMILLTIFLSFAVTIVTASSAKNCSMLPQDTCWSNPTHKLASVSNVSSDVSICCALCSETALCQTWAHGSFDKKTGTYTCDLYDNEGPTKHSDDGCSGGYTGPAPAPVARDDRPNIVFLVVESTDGRTWSRGYSDDLIPLPAIRELQENGASFHRHYSNAPVCCPSRATFWSGRHAHKIPHSSALPAGPTVQGAWNNFEGLPKDFDQRIDQVLTKAGYSVRITGKQDWSTGGHSENVRLNSWTMYTPFPYDIHANGGWGDEDGVCASNGTVRQGGGPLGNGSAHSGDWEQLKIGIEFIAEAVKQPNIPFFIYQGMNIVHPPYVTNEYWYNQIDPAKIQIPEWVPYEQMHPCDFQSSMLKKCTPSDANADAFYSKDRRRNVRRVYAAMIAEFGEMVGAYMDAVKEAGVWNQTVFIVTSDHGDMQMEHQQHYKMVPRDASASVPMVIFDARPGKAFANPKVVTHPTQLIDIYPTIMDYAKVDDSLRPKDLDGFSLVPIMSNNAEVAAEDNRAPFVTSQFHGCNIAMSWFLIVETINNHTFKLIQWGTGSEVMPQLFNLTDDPNEFRNLLNVSNIPADILAIKSELDANLNSTINYPLIAQQVAQYNKDSFKAWINTTKDWEQAIHASGLRWDDSWDYDPNGALQAVNKWMNAPAKVQACRADLKWPEAHV